MCDVSCVSLCCRTTTRRTTKGGVRGEEKKQKKETAKGCVWIWTWPMTEGRQTHDDDDMDEYPGLLPALVYSSEGQNTDLFSTVNSLDLSLHSFLHQIPPLQQQQQQNNYYYCTSTSTTTTSLPQENQHVFSLHLRTVR